MITKVFVQKIIVLLAGFFLLMSFFSGESGAEENSSDLASKQEKLVEIQKQIIELSQKISELQKQKVTLSNQIEYMDSQIKITELEIRETLARIEELEEEIENLSKKILRVEGSLSHLSGILMKRVTETYKRGNIEPWQLLLSRGGFHQAWGQFKYLAAAQKHDKNLMFRLEATKRNYKDQREILTQKREQVESLKIKLENQRGTLALQKDEKEQLLVVTQNDEKRFQALLEEARKEATQIEEAVGDLLANLEALVPKRVGRGEIVGIQGSTGFSTGPHLHFGVYNTARLEEYVYDQNAEDPCSYLSCDRENWKVSDGSFASPMKSPKVSQWYGKTSFSHVYRNGLHMGIDLYNNEEPAIMAAEGGEAYFYRGGQSKGNGVFIFHENGKMTLYWHLQ